MTNKMTKFEGMAMKWIQIWIPNAEGKKYFQIKYTKRKIQTVQINFFQINSNKNTLIY